MHRNLEQTGVSAMFPAQTTGGSRKGRQAMFQVDNGARRPRRGLCQGGVAAAAELRLEV